MKNKRILIITNNLGVDSGMGRYSLSIVNELSRAGVYFKILTEKNTKPVLSGEIKGLLNKSTIIGFFKNIIITRKLAKEFDVVHALDCWTYGVYAYFAVLGTRKKLFVNGVGTYSVPCGGLFKKFLMVRAYVRSEKVFCISGYAKSRILEIEPKIKAETVLLGATKLADPSADEVKDYSQKYKTLDRYPILLTVGGIKDRKGQLETLKAVKMLVRDYPKALYVIVGSNKNRSYISKIKNYAEKHNLSENILMLHDIRTDKELAYLYDLSDIFLLNSNNDGVHFEGFGLVLLEAAQFGRPVIGSSGCGIENAIENGYNGYLTEQRNPEDIYEKLNLVLGGQYSSLAANSKEFAKRFKWRDTVVSYLKYY